VTIFLGDHMSATTLALAALFALGMMGLGLTLLVKGAREQVDSPQPLVDGRRRPG
jgi:hypothetical protein